MPAALISMDERTAAVAQDSATLMGRLVSDTISSNWLM